VARPLRDGGLWGLSWSPHKPEPPGASCLSVLTQWGDDRAPEPRLERRHYRCSAVERVCVFGGNPGLVFSVCVVLRLAGVAPLSNSLETVFCREALDEDLEIGTPDIFNSDQGCQFTSADFTGALKQREIKISMDGRGRCFDNIFVERLWRSVKYEDVYLKGYQTMTEAQEGLKRYFQFYNNERFHQSIGYRTPRDVYVGKTRGVVR